MRARRIPLLPRHIGRVNKELGAFFGFLFYYLKKKITTLFLYFESQKNIFMRLFKTKRGRYNRPFLHLATMVVLGLGLIIGPMLADTFPIFSKSSFSVPKIGSAQADQQSIAVGDNVFATNISQKPRDQIITYTVQNGDTISTIAKKFNISEDTIRWENNLSDDNINPGDDLKILPVTGIAHKVESGDTVYTIAKKYGTDPQGIVDFPFNEFANPETFTLVDGEIIIVPNGVKPSEVPTYIATQQQDSTYNGQVPAAAGGWFFPLPTNTGISQYFSWYHQADDITAPIGTPIYAAHSGTVSIVHVGGYDEGYGTNVYIDDGDGYKTHYAHMEAVNVSVGQSVVGGQTVVGWVGLTGRTTGPHTHFEIIRNGVFVDPIGYVGTH